MSIINHPEIEMIDPAVLKLDTNNARRHPERQLVKLTAAIRRFGFRLPMLIDEDDTIVAGHARWKAALRLKLDLVPVIRTQFLDEDERRAFMLADNRLAELGEWDTKALQRELGALFDNGFDIELTGFSTKDLDFALVADDVNDKDEVERVELPDPNTDAVTRTGDLWIIGEHRLLCADTREGESWERLLGEKRADILFADPPYNVPINGFVSGLGQHRHREFAMAAGELTAPEFTMFLRQVFRLCVAYSRAASIHYHCMDWRHMRELLDAADGVYSEFKQLVVWDKGTGGMGTFYRSQHELVFAFKSGRGQHVNNFGLGETGRYRTNVVSYPGANTFRKGRAEDLAAHSTVKPTALVADFLLDCSNRGDLVVDPFVGSGTTLLAAARTGRRSAGIEIDPLYVDTALARLAQVTGVAPVLESDGRSFDEIAAARREREGEAVR